MSKFCHHSSVHICPRHQSKMCSFSSLFGYTRLRHWYNLLCSLQYCIFVCTVWNCMSHDRFQSANLGSKRPLQLYRLWNTCYWNRFECILLSHRRQWAYIFIITSLQTRLGGFTRKSADVFIIFLSAFFDGKNSMAWLITRVVTTVFQGRNWALTADITCEGRH